MTEKAGTKKAVDAKIPSVALQQRSGGVTKYAELTPAQLHQQTLNARETFFKMCVGAEAYAVDVLLPYCVEIIARYRFAGRRDERSPEWQAHGQSLLPQHQSELQHSAVVDSPQEAEHGDVHARQRYQHE